MASGPELLARLQATLKETYAFDVRFANPSVIKGSRSPERIGRSLFSDGLKYGAVLQDIEKALPLLEGSCLAFNLALKAHTRVPPDTTVYDKLHTRFTVNFGQFASTELVARREEPADTTTFRVGLSAMALTFTSRVLDDARSDPEAFKTADFAGHLLTFLSLTATARCWGLPIDSVVDERVLSMPLPRSAERLRRPLVALIAGPDGDAGALEDFRRAYRATIHSGAYRLGTIANVLFTDAYVWSLVKERGRLTSAVVNLLES